MAPPPGKHKKLTWWQETFLLLGLALLASVLVKAFLVQMFFVPSASMRPELIEAHEKAYGIPFPPTAARYDRLEDTLLMLPLLWGKGSPSFEGSTFSASKLTSSSACHR